MTQQYFSILRTKYDQSTFQKFAHELLNNIEVSNKSLEIDSPFKNHIDSLIYLGSYEDPQKKNLHILEVKLRSETKLEQARTMQRNLIARYLKDHWLDGALVAFYSENSTSWRLSFVKVEYKYDDSGKTKEEITPARRYSFLVGEGEPSHTAQTQLSKIYEQTSFNPTLAQLEEAFGVERVTREFFEKYRELFESVVAELKNNSTFQKEASENNIDTESFSKKLLGQIVFLYFLQKKGWLGVPKGKSWGEGDRMFLRSIFKQALTDNKNFFNNYLETLFYDTLNNPRNDKVDRNYSDYFQSKIPFLNGGLFEPQYDWKGSQMNLDNKLFDKILGVFDTYNFTVKEDEPLEKEVAVDPEMLGKVFENLLEENLRKGKGTYYTPREIVHYMCEESLINYLHTETGLDKEKVRKLVLVDKTIDTSKDLREQILEKSLVLSNQEVSLLDNALSSIKVCDPACGSGAFLVGMLQIIVSTKDKLTGYMNLFDIDTGNRSEYQLKKEAIQDCIYGVDLDPGAVEIAKLRLWLSLVVDYNLEEIEPLPNLDYKIMQGNSLLEEFVLGDSSIKLFEGQNLQKAMGSKRMKNLFEKETQVMLFDDQKEIVLKQMRALQLKYFSQSNAEEKKKIKSQIEKIEHELIETSVKEEVEILKTQRINIRTIPGIGLLPDDIKRLEKISSKENQIIAVLDELEKTGTKPFFLWHLHFADVFEEKGGFDIVIANPPYGADINKNELEVLKKKLVDTRNANSAAIFIDFGKNTLINSKGTLSYIVPKSLLFSEKWFDIVESLIGKVSILVDVEKAFENVLLEQVVFVYGNSISTQTYFARKFLDNKFIRSIVLTNSVVSKYKAWLCDVTEDELRIANNILDSLPVELLGKISETKRGVALQKYLKNKGDIPVIGGKNILRYGLNGYKGYLTEKDLGSNGNKITFLRQPKLISQRLVAHIQNPHPHILITCTFDETGKILSVDTVENTVLTNSSYNYKYILALLNSSLVSWYSYRFIFCSAIRTMDFDNNYVGKIPIPKVDIDTQNTIAKLVDEILSLTSANDHLSNPSNKAEVKQLEKALDDSIYSLYQLSDKERLIIEGNHD